MFSPPMLLLLLAFQAATDPGPTYSGVARQLDVRVPRIETSARIDGVLDEPVWRQAALVTGFSQYRPVDGRPAADSTQVLVWYSPDAIYFGIPAYESHGPVLRVTPPNRHHLHAHHHLSLL